MNIPSLEELTQQTKGKIVAIHGKSNVGKTTTSVATSPEPILLVGTEQRPLILSLENITKVPVPENKTEGWRAKWEEEVIKDWYSRGNRFVTPNFGEDTVQDFRDFWLHCYNKCNQKEFNYKTIVVDTISYWLNIIVMNQLQKEFYKDVTDKAKKNKEVIVTSLTDEYAIGLRQYGALANIGNSILSSIKPMVYFDVFIVLVFQTENNPSFNKMYEEAPYIQGKSFMKDFMGHFDYIGRVYERYETVNEVTRKTYPPLISFNQMPQYMTKWTGKQRYDNSGNIIKEEVMDFKKIFEF